MNQAYLQITYRRGRQIAAYFYLPRRSGEKSVETRKVGGGLLVDYSADGKALGIEITAPGSTTVEAINAVLEGLGETPVDAADLAPLHAA
jgi:uncharacterized protein YuzE